jgi:hypothetical protein
MTTTTTTTTAEETDREEILFQKSKALCDSGGVTFEEGWEIIKNLGLNTLSKTMYDFLKCSKGENRVREKKPFGVKGHSCLYTISYKITNSNCATFHGQQDLAFELYNIVCSFISDHLKEQQVEVRKVMKDNMKLDDYVFSWRCYKIMAKWLCILFGHLGDTVIKMNGLPSLPSVSLKQFYDVIYRDSCSQFSEMVLDAIRRERQGELLDSGIMQDAIEVIIHKPYSSRLISSLELQ